MLTEVRPREGAVPPPTGAARLTFADTRSTVGPTMTNGAEDLTRLAVRRAFEADSRYTEIIGADEVDRVEHVRRLGRAVARDLGCKVRTSARLRKDGSVRVDLVITSSTPRGDHLMDASQQSAVQVIGGLSAPALTKAVSQFMYTAVNAVMAAQNPLMGALGGGGLLPEGVSSGVVVQAGGASVASPSVALSHEADLPESDLRAGHLGAFDEVVASIASTWSEQFRKPLEEHFNKALGAVGNNVEVKKEEFGWDAVLDALEKVEWLPKDGVVQQPQMMLGADMEAMLVSRGDPTAEQNERLRQIFERKQEEYVSRRRSRRIR